MSKKQTAVEWLIEKIGMATNDPYYTEMVEQAKQMEKEQIVDAWDLGRRDIDYPADGRKYYNETYAK